MQTGFELRNARTTSRQLAHPAPRKMTFGNPETLLCADCRIAGLTKRGVCRSIRLADTPDTPASEEWRRMKTNRKAVKRGKHIPPKVKVERRRKPIQTAVGPKGRGKLTVHLERDLVERIKNAVYWNPRLTIARIAAEGIRGVIEEVESENGGPYRPRETELVGGRPIK